MPISSSCMTTGCDPGGYKADRASGRGTAAARSLPPMQDSFRFLTAGEIEKYTRSFNYPEESRIKSKDDIAELGIKTFSARMYAQHITVISSICWVDLRKGRSLMKI